MANLRTEGHINIMGSEGYLGLSKRVQVLAVSQDQVKENKLVFIGDHRGYHRTESFPA